MSDHDLGMEGALARSQRVSSITEHISEQVTDVEFCGFGWGDNLSCLRSRPPLRQCRESRYGKSAVVVNPDRDHSFLFAWGKFSVSVASCFSLIGVSWMLVAGEIQDARHSQYGGSHRSRGSIANFSDASDSPDFRGPDAPVDAVVDSPGRVAAWIIGDATVANRQGLEMVVAWRRRLRWTTFIVRWLD